MPRGPTRYKRMLNPQPLTFSPFARSVAQIASIHRDKRRTYKSKDQKGFPLSSKDKGIPKHTLEGKSDLSGSSEEEGSEGVVQADFVFFDPKPDDFHGVKILLQTYLDDTQWDLSGFVDLILAQTTVGTVVKMEGDDDDTPFSIVTALNLGRYKDHKCIEELKEFLLKVCQEKDVIKDLGLLMGEQAHDVGLLVSQRVVNFPQLLPPLHDALFDEVSWATEDEPTAELRNSFCFKCYLLVSKIYKVFLSWHLSTAPYILIINFFLLMIGFNSSFLYLSRSFPLCVCLCM
ncbi:protein BCCIP homolog isoform X6 [Citrus clementina]|uniref:protein BCCIP homolog isoform X6 n=1 Tax=Citrus clementina TaxID=85681 RepID=UPI000CED2BA5|nr:protein BCCIP homolog isoform X6 [Citrus x clementina]